MARATRDEVYELIEASFRRGPDNELRVHRSNQNEIRNPQPGHLYLVPGRPTDIQMASHSNAAGPAEAALMKINDAYFVKFGGSGSAAANIFSPQRDPVTAPQAIVEFNWINHTHPLDMANRYEGVAHGPTEADRTALRQISRRWHQTSSYVIVCRNGSVVRRVTFELERDLSIESLRDFRVRP